MMREWIVYSFFVGALLALAAAAIDAGGRALRVPTRWVWVSALGLVAVFAVSLPFRSPGASTNRVVTSGAMQSSTASLPPLTFVQRMAAEWQHAQGAIGGVGELVLDALVRSFPARVDHGLGLLWIVASLVTMVFFLAVYLRMRIALRSWPRSTLHDVEIRVAPNSGPAVVGLARPEIVLPTWIVTRSWEEQRLVLAHENAHRQAGDHIVLALGCLAAAALPWHPAVWWMLSRLRLAVELDCDRRVLARHATPESYGMMLIDLAGRCSEFRLGIPALADGTSHLERRIVAMTMKRSSSPVARAAGCGLVACGALLVACEAHVPTGPEIDRMDATSAQKVVTAVTGTSNAPAFYLDGLRISADSAQRIPRDRIQQIRVQKQEGVGAIFIASKAGSISDSTDVQKVSIAPGFLIATPSHANAAASALIFIDGVRSDAAGLHKLSPLGIKSMEVIKGNLARQRYPSEPDAANGVILVTTQVPAGSER